MNVTQAKQLDLRDLMSRLGHEPTKVTHGGNQLFYKAPWRASEKVGSVHATRLPNGIWIWNDQGEGAEGGSVIDLMIRLNGGGVREALHRLSRIYQGALFDHKPESTNLFSFQRSAAAAAPQDRHEVPQKSTLELVKVLPIRSKTILNYLDGRGIPSSLVQTYFELIQYRNTARPDPVRYGFGQRNRSGGYEVRSALDTERGKFKTAINGRDITIHKGSNPSRGGISIFEGMLDHVSLLVYMGVERLRGDALILNALSSYNRAAAYLEETPYERIDLWLDNNDAGRKATSKFAEQFGDAVIDRSSAFAPHTDLNDALQARHKLDFTAFK